MGFEAVFRACNNSPGLVKLGAHPIATGGGVLAGLKNSGAGQPTGGSIGSLMGKGLLGAATQNGGPALSPEATRKAEMVSDAIQKKFNKGGGNQAPALPVGQMTAPLQSVLTGLNHGKLGQVVTQTGQSLQSLNTTQIGGTIIDQMKAHAELTDLISNGPSPQGHGSLGKLAAIAASVKARQNVGQLPPSVPGGGGNFGGPMGALARMVASSGLKVQGA